MIRFLFCKLRYNDCTGEGGVFYYPESAASSLIVPIFLTKYHSEVILGEKRRNVICEVEFIPQWGAFCVAGGMFM